MREISDKSGNGMGIGLTKQALLEEELDAVGATDPVRVNGNFNISIQGTFDATFVIERSLDDGDAWEELTAQGVTISTYTDEMSESFYEPEPQALYRIRCSAYTSGAALIRIGK